MDDIKRTKILYIIDKLHFAGAQVHLLRLLQNMDPDEFECQVFCLLEGGEIAEEIKRLDIPVHILGIKKIYDANGISKLFELVKFIRTEKFDIVHNYLFSANIYGTIAAWIAGIKNILTSRRGTGKLREGRWTHTLLYKITNPLVSKVVCVTNSTRDIIVAREGLSNEKTAVVYNGIDTNFYELSENEQKNLRFKLGVMPTDHVIGFIANFNWIKGHETFIKAVREVIKKHDNTKVLLIGDGELKPKIQELVRQCGLEDHVLFLGRRDDVRDIVQVIDVSINNSYSEGMSNTLLESMAAGTPIVATDVDGNKETLVAYPKEDFTAIMVPPDDDEKLIEALEMALNNDDAIQKMNQNGPRRIRKYFTSEVMAKNMCYLYHSLFSAKGNKVAFLLSQFPEMHETFILREFSGQKRQTMNFAIYSYKRCRDKIVHPEAKELLSQTYYVPYFYPGSVLYSFFLNPIGFIAAYFTGLLQSMDSIVNVLKFQVVFLRSLYFVRLMKRHQISHIHAHWATMPTTGAEVIATILNIPFSFTAHAWDIYLNNKLALKSKIKKAAFAVTCTRANKIYLDKMMKKSGNGKVAVNYHGVDLRSFAMRNDHTRSGNIILAVGRLVEQKGFEYLIKACGILQRKSVRFKCILVGEGPLRPVFENLIANLGLRNCIELRGMTSQQEIKELFNDASVFCAPSVISANGDRDGIPNVILEALAKGVPVVASDVSGIPEVVIHRQTGLLVQPKSEASLALALEQILKETVPVQQLRVNGRKKIEEDFDADKNVSQLIDIFNEHGMVTGNDQN